MRELVLEDLKKVSGGTDGGSTGGSPGGNTGGGYKPPPTCTGSPKDPEYCKVGN